MRNCFFKNNYAVSQVVGYIFSLSLIGIVVTSSIVLTNDYLDRNIKSAAEIYAENLAGQIAESIIEVGLIKNQFPNANYSTSIDLPSTLMDRYNYLVDISGSYVYINTTDGGLSVKKPLYNLSKKIYMDVSGSVYGSEGKIKIFCNESEYIYRIDFCNKTSIGADGYIRVTEDCDDGSTPGWHENGRKYRIPIKITIPDSMPSLSNYQVLIQLNDKNFVHSLANSNGSDLRFINDTGQHLSYWIENWYSDETHTSRIWLNVTHIPQDTGTAVYMYFGNSSANYPFEYGGEKTFVFFEDFNDEFLDKNKFKVYGEVSIVNGTLCLNNESSVSVRRSEDILDFENNPYIIETKAKAVGENYREASMFAKSDGTLPPYESGTLFTSGSFSNIRKNLALINNRISSEPVANSTLEMKDSIWYRLSHIINYSADFVARYKYSTFSVEDCVGSDTFLSSNGYFGLCISEEKDAKSYFDWLYVRKFAEKTGTLSEVTVENIRPTAKIYGIESKDYFEWDDTSNLEAVFRDDSKISGDFIRTTDGSSEVFKIKGLDTTEKYSLTFTVGDKKGSSDPNFLVDNMQISVEGNSLPEINCETEKPYKTVWTNDVSVSGDLEIEFKDLDSSNEYWAICALTLEKGRRKIKIEGS